LFHRIAALAAVLLMGLAAAGAAAAQDVRRFDSPQALEAEIAGHMANARFSELVDAVAPAGTMSTGRIRIVEEAREGQPMPALTNSTALFRDAPSEGMLREVTAWWDGDSYVYLGLLTHARTDDVLVLDFLLTGNVTRASRWFLTGAAQ
jgi:hypothetical protein